MFSLAFLRILGVTAAVAGVGLGCGGPTRKTTGGGEETGGATSAGGTGGTSRGGSGGSATGGVTGAGGSAPADAAMPRDLGTTPDTATAKDSAPPRDLVVSADTATLPPPADAAANPALDQVCTPKFVLKLLDTGPKGQLFLDAMGGDAAAVEKTVQQIGRDICRTLYRKAEEVRPANELELTIRDYAGVAEKSGDIGKIYVSISTQHLQNVKNGGRDVGREIKGILYHEMTHMYQNDDKPEGTWSGLPNYYEAGADAVRIRYGYAPDGCRPSKQGVWSQLNYCGGGWWWLWVDTKIPDFMYKLNLMMKGRDGKAFAPADATAIGGVSLDALWTEYQGAACCSGTTTTCCK